MPANPELLTIGEAAEYLRCSASRLRKGWGPKPIAAYAPRRMYRKSDLDAFIAGDYLAPDATPVQRETHVRSEREREIAHALAKGLPIPKRK